MTAPGTVILLGLASCTWQGGQTTATTAVVVENPAIRQRIYCAAPVRRYKVAGQWRRWADSVLAGVKVRIQPPGTMWPVDGVATNDGRVCVGGQLLNCESLN
jgi:hypothetical protein